MSRRDRELLAIWLLLGAVLVAVVATYARLPPEELYNVSGSGSSGGLGRALVELNFPDALIALGVLALLVERLPRWGLALGPVAAVLCLVVVFPGVVDPGDLDPRPVNLLPALGVLLVLALWLGARPATMPSDTRGDRLRLALGAACLLVSIPWLAAEAGFFLDGVPVLGRVFLTGEVVALGDEEPHAAVHLGVHHGFHGLLLVVSALLASRRLVDVSGRRRTAAAAYLALMLAYGLGNLVNDGWLEQVAKRGWTARTFPDVLQPRPNWGWPAVLVAATLVWSLWFRARAPRRRAAGIR